MSMKSWRQNLSHATYSSKAAQSFLGRSVYLDLETIDQCKLYLGQCHLQEPIATLFRIGYPTGTQWWIVEEKCVGEFSWVVRYPCPFDRLILNLYIKGFHRDKDRWSRVPEWSETWDSISSSLTMPSAHIGWWFRVVTVTRQLTKFYLSSQPWTSMPDGADITIALPASDLWPEHRW